MIHSCSVFHQRRRTRRASGNRAESNPVRSDPAQTQFSFSALCTVPLTFCRPGFSISFRLDGSGFVLFFALDPGVDVACTIGGRWGIGVPQWCRIAPALAPSSLRRHVLPPSPFPAGSDRWAGHRFLVESCHDWHGIFWNWTRAAPPEHRLQWRMQRGRDRLQDDDQLLRAAFFRRSRCRSNATGCSRVLRLRPTLAGALGRHAHIPQQRGRRCPL